MGVLTACVLTCSGMPANGMAAALDENFPTYEDNNTGGRTAVRTDWDLSKPFPQEKCEYIVDGGTIFVTENENGWTMTMENVNTATNGDFIILGEGNWEIVQTGNNNHVNLKIPSGATLTIPEGRELSLDNATIYGTLVNNGKLTLPKNAYFWLTEDLPVDGNGKYYYTDGNEVTICTVVYDANIDGAENIIKTIRVAAGRSIDAPSYPRSGYSLSGWYKDRDGATSWHFESDPVTDPVTRLYAKWELMGSNTIVLNGNPNDEKKNELTSALQPNKTIIIRTDADTELSEIAFGENTNGTSHLVFEGSGHLTVTGVIKMPSGPDSTITVTNGANVTICGNITMGFSGNVKNKIRIENNSTLELQHNSTQSFDHLEVVSGGKIIADGTLSLDSPLVMDHTAMLELNGKPAVNVAMTSDYEYLTDRKKKEFAKSLEPYLPNNYYIDDWPETNPTNYTILDKNTHEPPVGRLTLKYYYPVILKMNPPTLSMPSGGIVKLSVSVEVPGSSFPESESITISYESDPNISIDLVAGERYTWTANLPNVPANYEFTAHYDGTDGDAVGYRPADSIPCKVEVLGHPAPIADAEVTFDPESPVYDGTAKTPATVRVNNQILTLDTDYTISYENNINAGEARAIITGIEGPSGIGGYTGTKTAVFTIQPAVPVISWGENATQSVSYTGSPASIENPPTVTLVNGETYTGAILYSYAKSEQETFTNGLPAEAGVYLVKASIPAQGNYQFAESTDTLKLTIMASDSGSTSSGGWNYWPAAPSMPFLKNNPAVKGWPAIQTEIKQAAEGSTISIDMNGTSRLPGGILNTLHGRNVTMLLDMGKGLSWSVDGQTATETVRNIDLRVSVGTNRIPEKTINDTANGLPYAKLQLVHEGTFDFAPVIIMQTADIVWADLADADKGTLAGMYANLFCYESESEELEFVCAEKIAENGTVPLTFSRASDCVVIVSEQPMGGQNPPESEDTSDPEEITDSGEDQTVPAKIKSVKLSKSVYTYNGKEKKPSVTVLDSSGKRVPAKYYDIVYKNNKKAGIAAVEVTFKGIYQSEAAVKRTFSIRPPKVILKKAVRSPGTLSLNWTKTAQTDGYQIQYSTKPEFYKDSSYSVFVKNAAVTKKTIKNKKLNTAKKYYVHIRAYKVVQTEGKNQKIYSAWSKLL